MAAHMNERPCECLAVLQQVYMKVTCLQVVGRPYMPPYWMLGFQLSRYGYKNVSMMKDSVDRTLAYDIPLVSLHYDVTVMTMLLD